MYGYGVRQELDIFRDEGGRGGTEVQGRGRGGRC